MSQRSGVSVRVSVANYENVSSNALKRAIRLRENKVVPRVSDLPAVLASTAGKIELETIGDASEERVVEKLSRAALLTVFNQYFLVQEFDPVLAAFRNGATMDVSDDMPSLEYARQALRIKGMRPAVEKLGAQGEPGLIASATEFILEGLHLNRKLNKERAPGLSTYRLPPIPRPPSA